MSSKSEIATEIPTKAVFNPSAFEQFKFYTKLYGKTEWGGLCIGFQEKGAFYVRAVLLPPQKTKSVGYCEFRKEMFPLVTKQLIKLQNKYKGFYDYRIGIWIHTHPGFGVFFSGTDTSTFKYLTSLAPEIVGVVVDPLSDQVIGYNGRTIKQEKRTHPHDDDLEVEINEELTADDADDEEEFATAYPAFEQVEIQFDDPERTDDSEEAFLRELGELVASKEAALELGDSTLIEAFVPLAEKEHFMKTLSLRMDYLEKRISDFEELTRFELDQSEEIPHLRSWLKKANLRYDNIAVPSQLVITKSGFHFALRSHEITKSYKLPWSETGDFEALEILKRPLPQYGATLTMVLMNIKRKKKGFLSRPKETRLLLLTYDFPSLQRCLLEFVPGSIIRPVNASDLVEQTTDEIEEPNEDMREDVDETDDEPIDASAEREDTEPDFNTEEVEK